MSFTLPRACRARLLLLCWSIVALSSGRAENGPESPKSLASLHQQVWRAEDGLPQNTVPAITQSKDGFLWLGTELGLVRFDGRGFTVFDRASVRELKSNVVDALLEDRTGNLWIGTMGGGLSLMANGVFKTLTTTDGLSSDAIRCLFLDKAGDLWIGTEGGGVNRLSGGRITTYGVADGLPDNGIFAFAEDAGGAIWIGTHNGLSRFLHGKFHNFKRSDGLPDNYVRALYTDRNDVLWIGTNGGLGRYKDSSFKKITTADGLSSNAVASIRADSSGSLWVGTVGGGINRIDGAIVNSLNLKNGFPSNDVWSIYEDRDHELWIGTGGGGLVRLLENTVFHVLGSSDGLSNEITLPVFEDHTGVMWIGTNGGGLNRIQNGHVSVLTAKDGLADNLVFSLCEDHEGALWVGTRKGLSRLQGGRIRNYHEADGLPTNGVSASLADAEGNVWFGTRAGLARFRDGRFTTYTTKDGLPTNVIRVIYQDHLRRLWIGTAGGGICRLENGKFQTFNMRQGLSNNVVFAIHEDRDGVLWIGTDGGGLNRFENGKFTAITKKDGLLDDAIFRIFDDRADNLWMSSNKGVFRVHRKALNAFAAHRVANVEGVSYGKADGMATAECNGAFQPAGWKRQDGKLWFPTMQGVAIVDPNALPAAPPPLALIDHVWVDHHEFVEADARRIPHGNGELEFYYTAPSLRGAGKVAFRYRLEGFDSDWTDAGLRRVAYYTNIPPGSYRFVVAASNGEGNWSSQSASFSLALTARFYQTRLFYVLVFCVLVAIAVAAHRWRLNHLRGREHMLERRVSERTVELRREIAERQRTQNELLEAKEAAERASRVKGEFLANMSHEIRTPMNGILGMTELALTSSEEQEQKEYLTIVKQSANHLLSVINDVLDFSKIESGKFELDLIDFDLRDNIFETVRSLSFRADQKKLSLTCDVASNVPQFVHTDPVRLRQILLNLLGNALKFTNNGDVNLVVRCESCSLSETRAHFMVSDTGIGIPEEQLNYIFEAFSQGDNSVTRKFGGTGLGLAICSRFVKLMGGEIWVESKLGQGSQFHFTIKLEAVASLKVNGNPRPSLIEGQTTVELSEPAGILIAEDNPASRLLTRVSLERAGFRVYEVTNGLQAVNAVRFGQFAVVLMDCKMPVMDGYSATRLIRQLDAPAGQTPIIALTASAFKEDRERTERVGMDDFLSKPFHQQDLIDKCVTWAKRKGPKDPAVNECSASHLVESPELLPQTLPVPLDSFLQGAPELFERMVKAIQTHNWRDAAECSLRIQRSAVPILDPVLQMGFKKVDNTCAGSAQPISAADLESLQRQFEFACKTARLCVRYKKADHAVA